MTNLLEKYRPMTLDEVYGQNFIVDKLKAYISDIKAGHGDGDFPHFMLSGPPGVGKTTIAYCVLRDAFGEEGYKANFMEKNASNVKIEVLRQEILSFAEKMPIGEYMGENGNIYDIPFNVIFLDEVDKLSRDSQQLLRRAMETCAEDTRFILACNYPNKIIGPIQSRCTRLYFKNLSPKALTKLCKKIAEGQGWDVDGEAYETLSENVDGDARRAISVLELGSKGGKTVTRKEILKCHPIVTENFNTDVLRMALSASRKDDREYEKDFRILESNIDKMAYDQGYSAQQILISISDSLKRDEKIPANMRRKILGEMMECNYQLHMVDNPIDQLKWWLRRLRI